jgi:hypothetical protein
VEQAKEQAATTMQNAALTKKTEKGAQDKKVATDSRASRELFREVVLTCTWQAQRSSRAGK